MKVSKITVPRQPEPIYVQQDRYDFDDTEIRESLIETLFDKWGYRMPEGSAIEVEYPDDDARKEDQGLTLVVTHPVPEPQEKKR